MKWYHRLFFVVDSYVHIVLDWAGEPMPRQNFNRLNYEQPTQETRNENDS